LVPTSFAALVRLFDPSALHRCSPVTWGSWFTAVARRGQRKKKPSRAFREQFGHTPVSLQEDIPWRCKRLVIGTGMEDQLPSLTFAK
jgi:hypothetical protein